MMPEAKRLKVCITELSSEDMSFQTSAEHIGRIVQVDVLSLYPWPDGFSTFCCYDARSGRRIIYHKAKYRTLAKDEGYGPMKVDEIRFPDTMYEPQMAPNPTADSKLTTVDVTSLMLICLGGWVLIIATVAGLYNLARWLF